MNLATLAGAPPLHGLGALLPIACAASFAAPDPRTPIVITGVTLLLSAGLGLAGAQQEPKLAIRGTIATVGGICWLGVLPGFYVALRYEPRGVALIVLVFAGDHQYMMSVVYVMEMEYQKIPVIVRDMY